MKEKEEEKRFYHIGARKKEIMKELKELQTLENNIEFLAQTLEPLVVANMEKDKFEKMSECDRVLKDYLKNFLTREKTIIETLNLDKDTFEIPVLDELNTLAKYFLIIEKKGLLFRLTMLEKRLRS